ncbi:MAG: TIGR02646 family protein [Bacteroidetes bacterium]|nr:TIGR02646 family protein [Bacteroidota bacterium]
MIRVNRTPKPTILIDNEDTWLNNYLRADKKYSDNPNPANKKGKDTAERKYNHSEIKTALKTMFSDKCAYCESHIAHIDYGHIEHYKPKSRFKMECFNWDNLLLGCAICNSPKYKSDHFPGGAQHGPIVNPTEEDPSNFFSFEFDEKTGTANVIEKHPRGLTTKNLLGLNRPELVRHRSSIVKLMAYAAIKASNGDNDARIVILKCCKKEEEYSAFAIELCKHFNIK